MTTTENQSDRLYGLPDAEYLHSEPAAVYESQIEPRLEHFGALTEHGAHATLHEWTVAPKRSLLPRPQDVLDDILTTAADDVMDELWDHLLDLQDDQDLIDAQDAVLELIANKIPFQTAGRLVGVHTITWDERGPLLDGEPLYQPAKKAH